MATLDRAVAPPGSRQGNRRAVLQGLATGAAVTRADMARHLGLAPPTISSLVQELIAEGLVLETGLGPSDGGRRPTVLAIDGRARQLITIDASLEPPEGQIINLDGSTVASATARRSRGGEDAVEAVAELVAELRKLASAPLIGVGVAAPGLVTEDGVIVEAANRSWRNQPLRAVLEAREELPVWVINDADAAVLAEFGALPEAVPDLALIRIGDGIGAGLILDGHPHPGQHAAAGEIGHLVVKRDGDLCACGRRGCLETVASLRAIVHRCVPGVGRRALVDVARSIPRNDPSLDRALDDAAAYLASVVAHLIAIIDLRDVVISVAVPGWSELLVSRIEGAVQELVLQPLGPEVRIRAPNKEEVVPDGAAARVLYGVFGVVHL